MSYFLHDDRAGGAPHDDGRGRRSGGGGGGGGRDRRGFQGDGGGGHRRPAPYDRRGRDSDSTTVLITGLNPSIKWTAVKDAFKDAGHVIRADTGGDGTGEVTFAEYADAKWAVKNWGGQDFKGTIIKIKIAPNGDARPEKGRGRGDKPAKGRGGREEKVAKTPEELDAAMSDYWKGKDGQKGDAAATATGDGKKSGRGKKKSAREEKVTPTVEGMDGDMDAYWAKKKADADKSAATAPAESDAAAAEPAATAE